MKLFILGSLIVYLIVILWTEKVRNDAKYSQYYNKDTYSCVHQRGSTMFYLGGGHPDVKLGISIYDFIHHTDCTIGDISIPRDEYMCDNNI